MITHLEKYGLELLRLGYNIVPLPAGSKGCKIKDWPQLIATEPVILGWTAACAGCGILSAKTVGVDIDCHDDGLTQYMLAFVRQRLGNVPHRVGRPPKALLPYRCEKPFTKMKSGEFDSPDSKSHLLEVLAEGQQFVASHIHPDTQKPYLWHYADGSTAENLTVPWADLPVITEEDAQTIVAEFELQCEKRGWECKKATRHSRLRPAFAHARHEGAYYSEGDVRDMLSFLDPSMTYEEWLRVGMALHRGGFAVELWDEWSKTSEKYKPGDCQYKWDTFTAGERL